MSTPPNANTIPTTYVIGLAGDLQPVGRLMSAISLLWPGIVVEGLDKTKEGIHRPPKLVADDVFTIVTEGAHVLETGLSDVADQIQEPTLILIPDMTPAIEKEVARPLLDRRDVRMLTLIVTEGEEGFSQPSVDVSRETLSRQRGMQEPPGETGRSMAWEATAISHIGAFCHRMHQRDPALRVPSIFQSTTP